jgi:hypothetical protein
MKIGFSWVILAALLTFSQSAKAELYGGVALHAGSTKGQNADVLGQAGLGLKLGGRSEQLGGYVALNWLVSEDVDSSPGDVRVGQFFLDGGLDLYIDWLRLTGFAGLASASAVADGDSTLIATGTSLGGGGFILLADSPKFDLDLGMSARQVFYTLKDDLREFGAENSFSNTHLLASLTMTWH